MLHKNMFFPRTGHFVGGSEAWEDAGKRKIVTS